MNEANPKSSNMVLTEDEALEVLAFLVTAARIQIDEPPDYAPMRLLGGAEKLADLIKERVSQDTRELIETALQGVPHGLRRSNFDDYVARLDEIRRAVAQRLVDRNRTVQTTL